VSIVALDGYDILIECVLTDNIYGVDGDRVKVLIDIQDDGKYEYYFEPNYGNASFDSSTGRLRFTLFNNQVVDVRTGKRVSFSTIQKTVPWVLSLYAENRGLIPTTVRYGLVQYTTNPLRAAGTGFLSYPNPSNGGPVTFQYVSKDYEGPAKIYINDMVGRSHIEIPVYVLKTTNKYVWDGKDMIGERPANGILHVLLNGTKGKLAFTKHTIDNK